MSRRLIRTAADTSPSLASDATELERRKYGPWTSCPDVLSQAELKAGGPGMPVRKTGQALSIIRHSQPRVPTKIDNSSDFVQLSRRGASEPRCRRVRGVQNAAFSNGATSAQRSEGIRRIGVAVGGCGDDQAQSQHLFNEAFRERTGHTSAGAAVFQHGDKRDLRIFGRNVAGEPAMIAARTCFGRACFPSDRHFFHKDTAMAGSSASSHHAFQSGSNVLQRSS